MEFAVGAGVGLITGRKEVGGDISFSGDVGDDFDFFWGLGECGEEFGFGVAFEKVFGDGVSAFVGGLELFHVGFVEEDLGFEDLGCF